MKTILISLLLFLTFNAFADCVTDYNGGIGEYEHAASYFDNGLNAYNKAVELSQAGNPDFTQICDLLVDSTSGFSTSKDFYLRCTESFSAATTSCSGSDSDNAKKNKEVCIGNYSIALDNFNAIKNLLKKSCFRNSKELEFVDLQQSEKL